ncbi:phage tail protein [Alkalihalophilus marmarensis]|uniref:phage tail protein n=1 Tax=Alkalihalophilus marmarensis TaxID=521377 RepID=UPI002DB8A3E8|nr:hypothetical protein [Alkalihalophilus marmarensis]MEC2070344.1 hypothetical protein [Alkalihalophilus marmarensis]
MDNIELFKLFGSIGIKDEASKEIDKIDGKAEKTGSKFGTVAKGVAVAGAAIGTAAIGAGAALFKLAGNAGDHADRLLDLNSITGMSTTAIQEWQNVAKVAGVDTETMTKASEKLTKTMDVLEKGTGKQSEAMKGLGLSYDQLNSASPDERMELVANALANVEDPAERARLGTDLLGGAWKDLAPIVSMGADGMDEARQKAHELGAVMSEDALNDANNFRIGMENLRTMMGGFAMQIGASVAPVLTDVLLPAFEHLIPIIMRFGQTIVEWILKAVDVMKRVTEAVIEWASSSEGTFEQLRESFSSFFNAVISLVTGFVQLLIAIWEAWGDDILAVLQTAWNLIVPVFQLALDLIIDVFNVFAALFQGDWKALWEAVKTLASNLWKNISNVIEAAMNFIKSVVDLVWNIIKDIINAVLNTILSIVTSIWNNIKSFIQTSVEAIRTNIQTVFNIIRDFFSTVWNAIQAIFNNVINSIVTFVRNQFEAIRNNIQSLLTATQSIISSIWNFIKGTFETVLSFLKSLVQGDFQGMRDAINTQMQNARELITSIWNAIKTFFSSVLGELLSSVRSKFQDMISAVRERMNNVKSTIESIWNEALSFLKGINLFQVGVDIIQGLINGIGSMANAVWEKAKGIATGIGDSIKSALGVASPAKVTIAIGKWTGIGLENGLEATTKQVEKAANQLAMAAVPDIDPYPITSSAASLLPPTVQSNVSQTAGRPQIIQNNTYNSPEPLDAYTINRKNKQNLQQLGMQI